MKLLRVGAKGKEKPAILDNNKIKDLSSHVEDFNPNYLNFETITKLKKIDLEKLPEISNNERIGSCINKPGKFVAIGLNYSDHASATGLNQPPITFLSSIIPTENPRIDVMIMAKISEIGKKK